MRYPTHLLAGLALISAPLLSAQTVITTNADDVSLSSTNSANTTFELNRKAETAIVAGYNSQAGHLYASVGLLFFALPTIDVSLDFSSAQLDLRIVPQNIPTQNLDAYIVGIQSGTTVSDSWYYHGPSSGANLGDTLVQASIATSATSGTGYTTISNAGASTVISSYLNANYNGAGSQFLVVRLNLDVSIPGGSNGGGPRYFIGSAENGSPATLTLGTSAAAIPEPSVAALFAGATLLGLAVVRRSRRQD